MVESDWAVCETQRPINWHHITTIAN